MSVHVLALVCVTLVWGGTFPVLKIATVQLSGLEVTALRFVLAAVCMLPFVVRIPRRTWFDGAILGALVLVSYVLQAWGLETISSNRSAFLTSLNVLMVPFLGIVFGTKLRLRVLAAAAVACAGIGLMSWEGGANLMADVLTVLSAFAYALYVVLLSQRAEQHQPIHLASAQIVWMASLGLVWLVLSSVGTDKLDTLPSRIDTSVVYSLAYLGIVATAGMLFLQAWAQRKVSADKAALVYALEPVFAALFAWVWLAETLSQPAAIGAAMVVGAVVFSEMGGAPSAKDPATS
ncbi:DMT family transporter [Rhodoferax aquaticus]|uniref:DMT family transporter n=1 Tax=Rhodoferax aquaticus TaxID=2527691 RepID=A0A515ES73_9BURK|nr:DMT family transporter [Rhodoferax aquaticus]QDL55516.1 DMT family transporter [Rhodoferax aquaticus]